MIIKFYTYKSNYRFFLSMKKDEVKKVLGILKYIITALLGYLGGNVMF